MLAFLNELLKNPFICEENYLFRSHTFRILRVSMKIIKQHPRRSMTLSIFPSRSGARMACPIP